MDETERSTEKTPAQAEQEQFPAALEGDGRDEELVAGEDYHPAGLRRDSRASVPGTEIPAGDERDE